MADLTAAEIIIRDNIMSAGDMVSNEVTEPTTNGLTRCTSLEFTSATVEVGKKYAQQPIYINPADNPAWGAQSGITEVVT